LESRLNHGDYDQEPDLKKRLSDAVEFKKQKVLKAPAHIRKFIDPSKALRYLLLNGNKVNGQSFYEKMHTLEQQGRLRLPDGAVDFFNALALDHFMKALPPGSIKSIKDLRRFVPEAPQRELSESLVLRQLLTEGRKPEQARWIDYVRILDIADESYASVDRQALGRAASALDNFGKKASFYEFADNYMRRYENLFIRLLHQHFASFQNGQKPTRESITLYFLNLALEDKLPEIPEGHRKIPLAPKSFLIYFPSLSERIFAPQLEQWLKAHDKAMVNNGGIDLTPANMHLQTQNGDEGIKFHLDPAMLAELQNVPGFIPVIINIQPTDLRLFLGLKSTVIRKVL
jgi:hypothetical protein